MHENIKLYMDGQQSGLLEIIQAIINKQENTKSLKGNFLIKTSKMEQKLKHTSQKIQYFQAQ